MIHHVAQMLHRVFAAHHAESLGGSNANDVVRIAEQVDQSVVAVVTLGVSQSGSSSGANLGILIGAVAKQLGLFALFAKSSDFCQFVSRDT